MSDPRTATARQHAKDEQGLVTGVHLTVHEQPSTRYRCTRAHVLGEQQHGARGRHVAFINAPPASAGAGSGARVALCYPYGGGVAFEHVEPQAGREVVITNKFWPPALGPLAIALVDDAGNIISDVAASLGLPGGSHICFELDFVERAEADAPAPKPQPKPQPKPAPQPVPSKASAGLPMYIHGLHDPGGERLMASKPGWIVHTEGIGHDPYGYSGGDYRRWAEQGFGNIVRLNNSHHGGGTFPRPEHYKGFAQRAANFVGGSHGAHIWVIGNETNHKNESPYADDSPIAPEDVGRLFQLTRRAIKIVQPHAIVCPPPVAPFDASQGDWVQLQKRIWELCWPFDGIAIHAYTHGIDQGLITSEAKCQTPGYEHLFWHLRVYEQFLGVVPAQARSLPVFITETDQIEPWRATGWIEAMYREINGWNRTPYTQKIWAACCYRYPDYDQWGMESKPDVLAEFERAAGHGYTRPASSTGKDSDAGQLPPAKKPVLPPEQKGGDARVLRQVKQRTGHGLDYRELRLLAEAETLDVRDGPRYVDGLTWYYLNNAKGGGWSAAALPNGTRFFQLSTVGPLACPFAGRYGISQVFGINREDYERFIIAGVPLLGHNGVDFLTPVGTGILATDEGKVVETRNDPGGYGLYVKLTHAWGESLYAHLSKITVKQGQQVKRGGAIGLSGNTGNSTGPHLHFAIRINPYDRADGWGGYSDALPHLAL